MLVASVLISALIPLFNILNFYVTYILLLGFSVFMIYIAFGFLKSDLSEKEILKAFIGINIYTLSFITLLVFDKFIFLMLK
jgi:hypothetical protein